MTNADAMKFGLFTSKEIFEGRWWSLITSAFVHVELTHLFFNMYWLYFLGPVIEKEFGALSFIAFIVGTAFVSSGWQLATGGSGIGFSGVGYAMIGFGWIARVKYPRLAPYFNDRNAQVFAGWALLCVILTYFKVMHVGNAAHVMGAVVGVLAGLMLVKKPWLPMIGIVALAVCAIVPVYYNPLSPDWNFYQGIRAHDRKDLGAALRFYHRSIERGFDDPAAWHNIALIEAYQKHRPEFVHALQELGKIDAKDAADLAKEFTIPDKP